ncbi:CynX/NimT family MFS transporter [Modestobacter roseus]|uniref:CP family cyanate transporter-like MFS transporter n=1 Tax=Modestobacter roseus TaxID=1181884 RepID=A0A562IUK1_9ACTN|nr:MFS transporter [Modestobacter roseus]MQA32926.1 MFS transporter [Modestobacter roseus]TWH74622.1 CP family cyanate transporter-like MFS transporter [Modestobacter roseus]
MTRSAPDAPAAPAGPASYGAVLVGTAIVLTGFNLRTAINSVGPVLAEIERGLGISSGLAGLITSLPLLCFAVIGFAGPPLAARFRDGHVLAAALLIMVVGLLVRVSTDSVWVFLPGTVATMVGGALGNVLLPGLVKRWFPGRTGLLVGAYSTAMAIGGAVASFSAAPIAAAAGADGWRWALGIWAVFALVAALPWLLVPVRPGASRSTHTAVPLRALTRSPLAWTMAAFFGLQAMQAYVIIGWTAQYLRDQGMSAAVAGSLVGLNTLVVIPLNALIPLGAVRQRLQRPLLLGFLACYLTGWTGLLLAPLTVPWLWVSLLGVGMGSFALVLALFGLRGRTPESVSALSTMAQGWGYALAGVGPLLVGLFRGLTGGYTGMFVLVYTGVALLGVTGWAICRERYVDDELPGPPPRDTGLAAEVEVAGAEPPIAVPRAPR